MTLVFQLHVIIFFIFFFLNCKFGHFQTDLSQLLQQLSEKARVGTEFIQKLKAMADVVQVGQFPQLLYLQISYLPVPMTE